MAAVDRQRPEQDEGGDGPRRGRADQSPAGIGAREQRAAGDPAGRARTSSTRAVTCCSPRS
ncbi:MAG TPA: hypothetical protein VF109_09560 [Mycobacteriales bacterium]